MPKSPKKKPAPKEAKSSSGKNNPDEDSIRAGQEVMCETRRRMEAANLGLDRGLSKLDQLLEAEKPIACNIVSKSGKKKDQKDADSLTTDFVYVPDNQAQCKALDMLLSLGDYYPDKKMKHKHEGELKLKINVIDQFGAENDTDK